MRAGHDARPNGVNQWRAATVRTSSAGSNQAIVLNCILRHTNFMGESQVAVVRLCNLQVQP